MVNKIRCRTAKTLLSGAALVTVLVLGACATPPPEPEPAPAPLPEPVVEVPEVVAAAPEPPPPEPPDPVDVAAEEKLSLAARHYEAGELRKAIALLAADKDIPKAAVAIRVRALKLAAFSRCTLGRKTECQRDFAKILALDPDFELSRWEAGNPNWDPAFRQARRALQQRKGS